MKAFVRRGRVAWYDATRGYGFVVEMDTQSQIFITKSELDAFGLTGLNVGLEIDFEVLAGQKSERVHAIKKLIGKQLLH
jgi:cold shock CspA family protein